MVKHFKNVKAKILDGQATPLEGAFMYKNLTAVKTWRTVFSVFKVATDIRFKQF